MPELSKKKNKSADISADAVQDTELEENGKKKSNVADAAFKKKVTIFNACLLLVFALGVCGVIFFAWYNNNKENGDYNKRQKAFEIESKVVLEQLEKIEADGGSHEDKRAVKIELTDENFYNWIALLDSTYNKQSDEEGYAAYGGAEIHLQGMFLTREYPGNRIVYWVYRNNGSGAQNDHSYRTQQKDASGEVSAEDIAKMIPIEVILRDGQEVPENGTWVDVTGVVGPDTFKNLSAARDAVITVMETPGKANVEP